MVLLKGKKLNQLLNNWSPGTVYVSSWLKKKGYGSDLVRDYKKGNWITTIGDNAVARSGDKVTWEGGVYALQTQLALPVHVGGKTSLEIAGYAHYLRFETKKVYLFSSAGTRLPLWFKNYNWGVKVSFVSTNLLRNADTLALTEKQFGAFSVKCSAPERAIIEALYFVPQKESFEEAFHLMEGLTTLRPALVQKLLESCNLVKVKRLFMVMAEKANHPWIKKLDLNKIDFGKGKRVLVKGGTLDKKHQITVPKNYYPETEEINQ
jgi:transcriptional regulator with AbiEi antitoxin domain of type IV toxin-antitoxin system